VSIDHDTLGVTAAVRKQVPVLLDFHDGRVYIENSNKKLIYMITVRLRQLGVEIIPVAWAYPRPNWPAEILNRLYETRSINVNSRNAPRRLHGSKQARSKSWKTGKWSPSSRTIFR
jgi:hypothetical protein